MPVHFADSFETIMGRLAAGMTAELREEVLPEAERLVPVRTGALKASLAVGAERDGTVVTAYVEAGEPYGPFVEFGTKSRPAKPFLRPSAAKFDLARVAARMKDGGE